MKMKQISVNGAQMITLTNTRTKNIIHLKEPQT